MNVREQYERFPYPPISPFATPLSPEFDPALDPVLESLPLEHRPHGLRSHRGAKILIVGAGTFEAAGIALAHPFASHLTAFDLSGRSLRIAAARIARLKKSGHTIPQTTFTVGDLENDIDLKLLEQAGPYDFILASNVLHHLQAPLQSLNRLASLLTLHGVLRMRVYPRHSRKSVDDLSQYFKEKGLNSHSPLLKWRATYYAWRLPQGALRASFFANPERRHTASLVDAFFHARVNSPSFAEWETAATQAGLRFVREDTLGKMWTELDKLDANHAIEHNPIIWLQKN